jgi:hypothetical protein
MDRKKPRIAAATNASDDIPVRVVPIPCNPAMTGCLVGLNRGKFKPVLAGMRQTQTTLRFVSW